MSRRDRKIDLIYKNLEHVTKAYSTAEGVFPYWETVFALIIGQLFIAYFSVHKNPNSLALLGLFLSVIWFILVSLNLKNAQYMDDKMKEMQSQLGELIEPYCLEFRKSWPEDKKNWRWFGNILSGTKPPRSKDGDANSTFKNESTIDLLLNISKSTWLYRRILPFTLLVYWAWFIDYRLAIAIMILSVLFIMITDP